MSFLLVFVLVLAFSGTALSQHLCGGGNGANLYGCAITSNATVDCWGPGQPFPEPATDTFSMIAASPRGLWACGILTDGNVWCPELAAGHQAESRPWSSTDKFQQLAVADTHACGIRIDNRRVQCWDLSRGANISMIRFPNVPLLQLVTGPGWICGLLASNSSIHCTTGWTSGIAGIDRLVAGDEHVCGWIRNNETLVCWSVLQGTQLYLIEANVTDVAAVASHTCFLHRLLGLYCWGPTLALEDPSAIVSADWNQSLLVTSASGYACFRAVDATIVCRGQAAPNPQTLPRTWRQGVATPHSLIWIDALSNKTFSSENKTGPWTGRQFVQVACGDLHYCGLTSEGEVICRGSNGLGQLSGPALEMIRAKTAWEQVVTGQGFTCAHTRWNNTRNQTVWCWGSLNSAPDKSIPWNQLVAGGGHVCGLENVNQTVICWGLNDRGQASVPLSIASKPIGYLACGTSYTCVATLEPPRQDLVCWGDNTNGQLNAPNAAVSPVTTVGASPTGACAARFGDGRLLCWGTVANPLPVLSLGFIHLIAGSGFFCGIVANRNGDVVCWGTLASPPTNSIQLPSLPLGTYRLGRHLFPTRPGMFVASTIGPRATSHTPLGWGWCAAGNWDDRQGPYFNETCAGPCPIGSYCLLGALTPTPCPTGRYGDVPGYSTDICTSVCPFGHYCPRGVRTPCPAGRFGNTIGSIDPQCSGPCRAGSWCPVASISDTTLECGSSAVYCPTGSALPLTVPAGFYSVGGTPSRRTDIALALPGSWALQGIPSNCLPGTYTWDGGQSACIDCEPGFFAPHANATSCLACPAGTFQDTRASKNCLACPPGRFQNATGQVSCEACAVGKSNTKLSQETCMACPSGRFQAQLGGYTCLGCPPGSFQTHNGSSICQLCAAGRFQSENGQTACLACRISTYVATPGAASCLWCDDLTRNNAEGDPIECILPTCSTGTGMDLGYARRTGDWNCAACPTGRFGLSGGRECSICPSQTYTIQNGSTECRPCDTNPLAAFTCAEGHPIARPGYWLFDDKGQVVALPCPIDTSCPGGSPPGRAQCQVPRNPSPDNILCGKCLPGYSEWSGECIACENPHGGWLFFSIVLLFLYVLIIHRLAQVSQTGRGQVGIVLYFVQTALVLLPRGLRSIDWLKILAFAPQEAAGPVCVVPISSLSKSLLTMSMPWIATGCLLLVALLHQALFSIQCLLRRYRTRTHAPHHWIDLDAYVRSLVSLYLWSFTHILSHTLPFLQCVDVGQDHSVVYNDPSISCRDPGYQEARPWAIFLLVFHALLIPLFLVGRMWRSKVYLSRDAIPTASWPVDANRFQKQFGNLFEPFRAEYYWWTFVILARRSLIAVAAVFLFLDLNTKFMMLTLLGLASLGTQMFAQPFVNARLNHMEHGSLLLLVILTVILTAFPNPTSNTSVQVIVSILVLVPPILAVIYFVGTRMRTVRSRGLPEASSEMVARV